MEKETNNTNKKNKEQPYKKLKCSSNDVIIAGVCGGIGEYFEIDSLWIRLIAILLIFFNGLGIILYLVAWILMEKPNKMRKNQKNIEEITKEYNNKGIRLVGIIFILFGIIFFLKNYYHYVIDWQLVWPVLLVLLGLLLLFKKR